MHRRHSASLSLSATEHANACKTAPVITDGRRITLCDISQENMERFILNFPGVARRSYRLVTNRI